MPIRYKIDVLGALKEKGFSSYKIRHERIMGEQQMQQIREGVIISTAGLEKLCRMLDCQPGDLLEYVPEDAEK